jgi:dienelactone hydrolase
VEVYPGARHGFDATGAPPVLDIGNGMTVGYQKEAAEASWDRLLSFLAGHQ